MPALVGILAFMSRLNFVPSWVGHEKKVYNFGARTPDKCVYLNSKISIFFLNFWTKTYAVGTQKNCLYETAFWAPKTYV